MHNSTIKFKQKTCNCFRYVFIHGDANKSSVTTLKLAFMCSLTVVSLEFIAARIGNLNNVIFQRRLCITKIECFCLQIKTQLMLGIY